MVPKSAMPRGRVLGAAALVGLAGCSGTDGLDAWPAQLVARSPISQTGLMGYTVNDPPAVLLLDVDGKPIPDAEVTFTVAVGGGSVTGGVATTGSDGIATVGGWSVPLGTNALIASIPAPFRVDPVTFRATGVGAAYQISVVFLTATTPERRAVFTGAAARWQQLIYGDVPDINLASNPIPPDLCFVGQPGMAGVIDDVLIHVILDSIDGPDGVLGGATPCFIRNVGKLPLEGVMIFDTADVAALEQDGLFDEVILHEMGHVLGFGTICDAGLLGLLVFPGTSDPYFSGAQARGAFDRIGGTSYTGRKVPVENTGGPGTRDSHWRESVFDNELMTGFLNVGVANPLSVVTVAAQRDAGYLVNYAAADVYARALAPLVPGAPGGVAARAIALGDDVLRLPIHVVDRDGRITHVYRP
ncbi:MAG: leishmanolysin-related zinc metalloendopeptidase [Gemmatimonadales bacterium]